LPGEITEWLLAVNLLNLMALPGKDRNDVLAEVRRRATRVARQHGATASDLSNIGILLTFADNDPDQCFKVLCAALLLAESLDNFNEALHLAARPEMKFRFGAHVTTRSDDAPADANSDAVQDTVELSAVAPEGSIAASHDAFERLPRPERFIVEEQTNPIRRTLTTASHESCVIVSAVADAYGAALDHQAELLRSQEDSTSTPSTL
jgi:class 3 adenylate cyclase